MNNNEIIKCKTCEIEKPITDFYKSNKSHCKLCHNKRSLSYFENHPEKLNYIPKYPKPKHEINQLEFNFCISCNDLLLNENNNSELCSKCVQAQKLLYSAKHRAKINKLDFNLELKDIRIPDFCPVLKIKLEINKDSVGANSPSLDKIIPNKGYVKGNIRVISHRANWLKNNSNKEELTLIYQDSLNNY